MGRSACGHIYYGVSYGEDDPRWPEGEYGRERPDDWDDETDDDWEGWIMKRAGWENPYSQEKFPPGYPERNYADRSLTYLEREAQWERAKAIWEAANPEWTKYREDYWAAAKKLVDECPVEYIRMGYEYGSHALAVRGTHLSHDWGGEAIPANHFALLTQHNVSMALLWCEENGIDFKDPQWILGGSYG